MDSLAVFVKLEGWKVYIEGGTNLPMPKIDRERPQGTFDSASGSDGNLHPGRPELPKASPDGTSNEDHSGKHCTEPSLVLKAAAYAGCSADHRENRPTCFNAGRFSTCTR